MTQIRELIENLCVVFKYNGISELTAETYRQAKFNKPEATKPMWKSLKNALIWIESANLNDQIPSSEDSTLSVRFCKHEMFTKGYRVRSFFVLPEDMSYGSRDILLCLGWLMAKNNLIQKLINRVNTVITEDIPCIEQFSHLGIKIPNLSDTPRKYSTFEEELASAIQEVVLLKGKLQAAFRSLLAAKNEYAIILNKIHSSTMPFPAKPSTNHLSALDVYLLYYPKELKRYQELLERDNHYLHSLLSLKENESLLWKWLESVLDLRDSEVSNNSDSSEDEPTLTLNQEHYRPSKHAQYIKTKQVDLSKHLQENEFAYKQVSTQWKRYRDVVEKSQEIQEQFHSLLACLDQEVLEELDQIYNAEIHILHKDKDCKLGFQSTQGVLQLLTPLTPQQKQRKRHSQDADQSILSQHINELKERDQELKRQLERLKKENSNKITKVALTLDEMVCIPPK